MYKTDLSPRYKQMIEQVSKLTKLEDLLEVLEDKKEFFRKYSTRQDIDILFTIIETEIVKIESLKDLDYKKTHDLFLYYYLFYKIYENCLERDLISIKTLHIININEIINKSRILIVALTNGIENESLQNLKKEERIFNNNKEYEIRKKKRKYKLVEM